MPLLKSKSISARRRNYLELISGPVGATRQKAIRTLMRRRGISYEKAKALQAKAIAFKKGKRKNYRKRKRQLSLFGNAGSKGAA